MEKTQDLIRIIQSKFPKLSKGQKMIADYILKHYDKAAFMTAAKLGSAVDVSESTVVRFAIVLGFDGYPELQKALQELVKTKLTAVQRLELTEDMVNEEDALRGVLKSDMENIRATLEKVNQRSFNEFIDNILSARKIYIIGLRSSKALSDFLGFYLNLILDNITVLNSGIADMYEQMIHLNSEDIVIGIGFPRYSYKTVEVLEFAKKRKAGVLSITDSLISPLASKSDITLIAQSNMSSFVDSLVAPLSIINAIIISVGLNKKDEVSSTFDTLEQIWSDNHVYAITEKEEN